MPAVGRIGDQFDCGDFIAAGSSDVFVEGIPVGRHGDATTGHQGFNANAIVVSPGSVFINGIPVATVGASDLPHHQGDSTHVGTLVNGSPSVFA